MSHKQAKSNLRFLANDHELDESGHGLFERDNTGRPKRGLAGVSDPRQSDLGMSLLAVINAAIADLNVARPPAGPPIQDLESIFEGARLTGQEARAWELRLCGFSLPTIAMFMGVEQPANASEPDQLKPETVETYLLRGRAKLLIWSRRR